MAIIDWTLLTANDLQARMAENATPGEQAQSFMHIAEIVRSQKLRGVIVDMDHAAARLPGDAADFAADLLARELRDSGLQWFTLVDHAIKDAWWVHVVDELRDIGIDARRFDTVREAKALVEARPSNGRASMT